MPGKLPVKKENKIISLYTRGLSMQAIENKTGIARNTVMRVLHRNDVRVQPEGKYARLEVHRSQARELMEKLRASRTESELHSMALKGGKARGVTLRTDIAHQRRAGYLGGIQPKRKRFSF